MKLKVEKTPRQFVEEICGLSRKSVSRILNGSEVEDVHGVKEELELYLDNSVQYVRKRRAHRAQRGLKY